MEPAGKQRQEQNGCVLALETIQAILQGLREYREGNEKGGQRDLLRASKLLDELRLACTGSSGAK